ncbi:MAG: fatty acid desaturase [Terrimicrobiaceae bacterium]|nr:fatty acid desaturase [Terrimicrobiaceae bacterium]
MRSDLLKGLHERSDARGWMQSLGYLGLLVLTGGLAFYAAGHWPVPVLIALLLLHGTFYAFQINAVHELGHGTVFKTKILNRVFLPIFAFLGWINFEMFEKSHARHHRYTLHPPEDLEVVLPIRILVSRFFLQSSFNPMELIRLVKYNLLIALGKFSGEWELKLFPDDDPERQPPIRWARILLVGHGLILITSIYFHLWMIPVLVTFAPFYAGWLFFLCNNTQHNGLQDNVSDFRLCCRTFTVNPVVQFIYWHMNYHIEHHMYAAVPCYNLGKLHELIKYDLPPCPHGLIATWKEIAAIQRRQEADPAYQYKAPLPSTQLAGY